MRYLKKYKFVRDAINEKLNGCVQNVIKTKEAINEKLNKFVSDAINEKLKMDLWEML